jgi:hypothetical protein
MRAALLIGLSLLPLPASAEQAASLGERLDMTTFSNSLGPRHEKGPATLADFGFVASEDGITHTEADGSWRFVLTPLTSQDGRILVCVEDEALNGGSYHTRRAYELIEGATGLLAAVPGGVSHPDCAERD